MGSTPSKKIAPMYEIPMKPFRPVYVPLESLTESTVQSVIKVVQAFQSFQSPTFDYSERTLLIFLLAIHDKLEEIEQKAADEEKIDPELLHRAQEIRQWLVDREKKQLNWDKLKHLHAQIAEHECTDMAHYYGSKDATPYFELRMKTVSLLKCLSMMKEMPSDGIDRICFCYLAI